ncbi:MAG: GerMN domain-containing protein [Actinomycetota bacterium]|nr:GerMN domain-containing protein [Actinomycetota bacterium]
MHRRFLTALLAATLASTAMAACSVVDDGKVSRINPPGDLDDTLPSTTSTSTTMIPTSTSGLETSTSIVQTELVRLYYIAGGQLTYVNQALPSPVVLQLIVSALQSGPPPDTPGLRTAIPPDAVIMVRPPDGTGVARVDLPDRFFDEIAIGDQRYAIAQIVLTLTDSRGIGQVTFDLPVTKPSGEFVAAGTPVTHLDYQSLTGTLAPPESTTGTTTSDP